MMMRKLMCDREASLSDEKIPAQRVPGVIRWPIRMILLPFILLDGAIQKIVMRFMRPPYKRKGACLKCGRCCHFILIDAPQSWVGRFHLWWNTEINGFYLRNHCPVLVDGRPMLVLSCRYLKHDGSCKHHWIRAVICRNWPIIEHFGDPQILDGCGYRAIQR